jgi:methionyl-tRNA formyltransferase
MPRFERRPATLLNYMRLIYMGTPEFARVPLVTLLSSRHQVLAVVTGADKLVGRGRRLLPTPVKQEAEKHGLTVYSPLSLKSTDLGRSLASYEADLFVVVAFRILPESLFALPRLGSINIHASLLPKYRGAAPINWALINGERETGLSAFFLKREVDTGDVILQERTDIDPDENFDSLYARLAGLSGPFLLKALDLIERGSYQAVSQDDRAASAAPKITPFNATIDFGFPAENVRNFVRGLATRPGAYTYFRGKRVKILNCSVGETNGDPHARPGAVLPDRKRLLVQCAHSVLELITVVPEGKGEMDGVSFINGFRLRPGEVFGEVLQGVKEKE